MKIECEKCENGMVFKWMPTRHGWDTKAHACDECNGSGKVDAECDECGTVHNTGDCPGGDIRTEGDERHQPHRDSGLPTFEQIEEWERLR